MGHPDDAGGSACIRPAREDDLAVLREIERASGQRYREYGLAHVADDEPAPVETLRGFADDGRAWVAVGTDDEPLGYLLVEARAGCAHIAQVSVLPEHQGRGLGRALIGRAGSWAASAGLDALTLTTFGHIPWNRPLYEHLGFRVLGPTEIGAELEAVLDAEAAQGLERSLRVAMRRDLAEGS